MSIELYNALIDILELSEDKIKEYTICKEILSQNTERKLLHIIRITKDSE